MEKSDIKLNLRIEIPQKLRFNDADICVILGNCLDNSIEAVCKLDDVSKREVNVDLVYRKKGLLIKISNPFSGDIKKDTNRNLVTTKADKENHGMGLCSVKNAVSKYNGAMNISTDNSMFKGTDITILREKIHLKPYFYMEKRYGHNINYIYYMMNKKVIIITIVVLAILESVIFL